MLSDYHVHTDYSPHAHSSVEAQLAAAAAAGLDEICFTDHMENGPLELNFHADFTARNAHLLRVRDTAPVPFKIGAEFGMTAPDGNRATEEEIRSFPYDFVLLSLHELDQKDIYFEDLTDTYGVQGLIRYYLRTYYEGLITVDPDCFSSAAHLDYMEKCAPAVHYRDGIMRYEDAPDEFDEIFRYVIEHGKCIEINTSVYKKLPKGVRSGADWLRRYRELGGEYVTIGSDAHATEYVGYEMILARELALSAGIKYQATYEAMKPVMHML